MYVKKNGKLKRRCQEKNLDLYSTQASNEYSSVAGVDESADIQPDYSGNTYPYKGSMYLYFQSC